MKVNAPKVGDVVKVGTISAKIKEVVEWYTDEKYMSIEFYDTNGQYRSWKQRFDGGELIRS